MKELQILHKRYSDFMNTWRKEEVFTKIREQDVFIISEDKAQTFKDSSDKELESSINLTNEICAIISPDKESRTKDSTSYIGLFLYLGNKHLAKRKITQIINGKP